LTELRFAHLSDLHLPLADRPPRLRDLMSKRLFSYLSWKSKRRRIHRPEVLARVMEDIRAQDGGHLLVTGDLTNLALPDEFERARDWLVGQGDPGRVTVVPGNHDTLVKGDWRTGLARWSEWMGGPAAPEDAFPFVKRVGEAALIGVSTAVPTAPFMATGRVGDRQLFRLARHLATLGAEGAFRIVLLHHPIMDGAVSGRKALDDRAALRQVLAEYGAELVLHGHSHHASFEETPGPAGPIPVVGAPSASAAPEASSEAAGWRTICLTPSNDAWDVAISTRSMGMDGAFSNRDDQVIRVRRPKAGVIPAPAF
jgi:3',5'-cyclic AMP phosphodiesterase CpdA